MDYIDYDNEKALVEKISLCTKIKKIILENKCDKHKKTGDRVKIWDWSMAKDLESGEEYDGLSDLADDSMIIIKTNCNNIYTDPTLPELKRNRDIVVYSPKYKRKIATCMDFVKLIE